MASPPRTYTLTQFTHFKKLSGALLKTVKDAKHEASNAQEDTTGVVASLEADLSALRAQLFGDEEVDVDALMTAFMALADEHEYCVDALYKAQAVLQASKADPADYKEVVAGCQYFERQVVVADRDELAADLEKAKEKLTTLEAAATSAKGAQKASAARAAQAQEEVVSQVEEQLQEKKELITWGDADAHAAELLVRPVMTTRIVGDKEAYRAADAASGLGGLGASAGGPSKKRKAEGAEPREQEGGEGHKKRPAATAGKDSRFGDIDQAADDRLKTEFKAKLADFVKAAEAGEWVDKYGGYWEKNEDLSITKLIHELAACAAATKLSDAALDKEAGPATLQRLERWHLPKWSKMGDYE